MRIESFAALAIAVAIATVAAFVITGRQAEPVNAGTFGTVTVTSPLDADASDFTCTLREAIVAQNNDTAGNGCTASGNGPDRIVFDLGPGPVINISAASMPSVTATVEIDGGPDRVELRGPVSDLFPGYLAGPGIRISGAAASGSVVRRMAINRFSYGILIAADAADVQILGNFLGTDASGTVGSGNYEAGIGVQGPNARIGGTNGWQPGGSCTGDCNLISGHTVGNSDEGIRISVGGVGAVIQGNMLGTNAAGTQPIANGIGVRVIVPDTLIGGPSPGEGNLVATGGISVIKLSANIPSATIQGNYLGTDTTGTSLLVEPDHSSSGIYVDEAQNVVIGGESPGERNVIAYHNGIQVIQSSNTQILGNFIGTAVNGTTALVPDTVDAVTPGILIDGSTLTKIGGIEPGEGNVIANRGIGVVVTGLNGVSLANQVRGNSIHSNLGLGIDTTNGGNGEPPPPVITSADQTGATGTSALCAPCAIEVYSDSAEEGRIYEGTTQTDLLGNWTFTGSLVGPNVTAIRTDDGGNSSEFSAPFTIEIPTPTPSPSPSPTATPTPTPTPTATPTPTPTGQPTPTPTPTSGGQQVAWGDHNCSGSADPVDALLNLRHDAGLPSETNECPEMGATVDVDGTDRIWGDFDCSGAADPVDGLKVLRFDAGLDVARPPQCPEPGETVAVTSA